MGKNLGAIILAAGKGKRMNLKKINKVMLPLVGQPMLAYTLNWLKKLKIKTVVLVVGFAKDSITKYFGQKYLYAWQKKRLGTAHAVRVGLKKLPQEFEDILLLTGDDSAFYPPGLIRRFLKRYRKDHLVFSFLTIKRADPSGLGRILRPKNGQVWAIVEEKETTPDQKKIREINAGCYLAKRAFLEKYLPQIKKNLPSGEYYLTDLVKLAYQNKENFQAYPAGKILWRGVNTFREWQKANQLMAEKIRRKNYDA